jgi:hypothetical protein
MAGVAGPFTLAAQLTQLDSGDMRQGGEPSESALELSAAAITKVASAFVEAGANLIFIREETLPTLSPSTCQNWESLLAPVFNIIRFYEALPVLQISAESATAENVEAIFQQSWDAILCSASEEFVACVKARNENFMFGFAVPLGALEASDSIDARFPGIANSRPALLTTDGDVPVATDLKRLTSVFDSIARRA